MLAFSRGENKYRRGCYPDLLWNLKGIRWEAFLFAMKPVVQDMSPCLRLRKPYSPFASGYLPNVRGFLTSWVTCYGDCKLQIWSCCLWSIHQEMQLQIRAKQEKDHPFHDCDSKERLKGRFKQQSYQLCEMVVKGKHHQVMWDADLISTIST